MSNFGFKAGAVKAIQVPAPLSLKSRARSRQDFCRMNHRLPGLNRLWRRPAYSAVQRNAKSNYADEY
jgi:hypothetical protein